MAQETLLASLEAGVAWITRVGLSDAAKEGIAAFLAKREPEWKGR